VADIEQPRVVICDAGPLIHLDELGCLDLLCDFRDIFVPDAVWNEVARHRPSALRRRRVRLQRVAVSAKASDDLTRLAETFALAAGEVESLILMMQHANAILLTDDAAARLVAQQLGYDVHGTIGVIVEQPHAINGPNDKCLISYAPFRAAARCTLPSRCSMPSSRK
jgi:predicted nucleic acid-binding protein